MTLVQRRQWVREQLAAQVLHAENFDGAALGWYDEACAEIADGTSNTRFGGLIALASRKARRRPVPFNDEALASAGCLLTGWNPERWSLLDLLRVGLVLARQDLNRESAVKAILACLEFADVGELCALYRVMALLPEPQAYVWQAAEGCRSNMTEVFEAIACDNPFPAQHFDEVAWRSLVIKALFVEAPLWRVHGLDTRLGEDLAGVALDLADERRSAGRPVQLELWLCLGRFGGERALQSMEQEMRDGSSEERCAAAMAFARAGHMDRLQVLHSAETDELVLSVMDRALAGHHTRIEFRSPTFLAR